MARQPYTLFRRGKNKAWYVKFSNVDKPGEKPRIKSVDTLRKEVGIPLERGANGLPLPISKSLANAIVLKAYEKGFDVRPDKMPYLKEYIENFWDYEKSAYIRERNADKPGSVHQERCAEMLAAFHNHAEDSLPKNLRLHELTVAHIRKIKTDLQEQGYANGSISNVLSSLKVPVGYAQRQGLIKTNPCEAVTIPRTGKERGILTQAELLKFLRHCKEKAENGNHAANMVYLASRLSAETGMRKGEIVALMSSQIEISDLDDFAMIRVDSNIARITGRKDTKGKKARIVPCSRQLGEELVRSAQENPWGNDYVMWRESSNKPYEFVVMSRQFYSLLDEALGMTEEERQKRNVVFHSLRHSFVSYLRGKVDETTLGFVVGHEDVATTDVYTHEHMDQIREVAKAQKELFAM